MTLIAGMLSRRNRPLNEIGLREPEPIDLSKFR